MRRNQLIERDTGLDSGGFTLIEVVIAMAIFSIGILAIAGLQVTATSGNAKARFATEAATLAQDVVERLMALDYDPGAVPQRTEFDNTQNGNRAYQDPTSRYTVDWTVSAADTPINNAIRINVTVRWRAYGIPRRYNINFIKTAEI
jgi:type IV pilus modification protein PilV